MSTEGKIGIACQIGTSTVCVLAAMWSGNGTAIMIAGVVCLLALDLAITRVALERLKAGVR